MRGCYVVAIEVKLEERLVYASELRKQRACKGYCGQATKSVTTNSLYSNASECMCTELLQSTKFNGNLDIE